MQRLPKGVANTLLTFLTKLREEPEFLAERLGRLTSAELDGFVNVRANSPLPAGPTGGSSKHHLTTLHDLQRHEPLRILLHVLFAPPTSSVLSDPEHAKRLEVMTTCTARLLAEKKSEKFLLAMMDEWSSLYPWSRDRFEEVLLGIVQEGAEVLAKYEEAGGGDGGGGGGGAMYHHYENNTSSMSGANDPREAFFADAVEKVFTFLDSPSGIPRGILLFARSLLAKADRLANDENQLRYAELFVVVKWFFFRFLGRAIAYPEQHGLFGGCWVSDVMRQRVLFTLHQRLYRNVTSVTHAMPEWSTASNGSRSRRGSGSGSGNGGVEKMVRSIISRFSAAPAPAPAGEIEIEESRPGDALLMPSNAYCASKSPYASRTLLVCPADLVALFQALNPNEPQPSKPPPMAMATRRSSVASKITLETCSEVSPGPPTKPLERKSHSHFSLFDFGRKAAAAATPPPPPAPPEVVTPEMEIPPLVPEPPSPYDGFVHQVRFAIDEMKRILNPGACDGAAHPVHEKWALVFVDGEKLSLEVKLDEKECREGPTDISEDIVALKETVLRLLREYEVPYLPRSVPGAEYNAGVESGSSLASPVRQACSSCLRPNTPNTPSVRLTSPPAISALLAAAAKAQQAPLPTPLQGTPPSQSLLLRMLRSASEHCRLKGDFVTAQAYHHAHSVLRKLNSPSLTHDDYSSLLRIFIREHRRDVEGYAAKVGAREDWYIEECTEAVNGYIKGRKQVLDELRTKMWYSTDVRKTKVWERARDVCRMLKSLKHAQAAEALAMLSPSLAYTSRPSSSQSRVSTPRSERGGDPRYHTMHRAPSREGQREGKRTRFAWDGNVAGYVVDGLLSPSKAPFSTVPSLDYFTIPTTAPTVSAGKMADHDVDIAVQYISGGGIFNFCPGEERMARFCAEVEGVGRKVMLGERDVDCSDPEGFGVGIWQSELFMGDAVKPHWADHYSTPRPTSRAAFTDTHGPTSTSRRSDELFRKTSSDLLGLGLIGRMRSNSLKSTDGNGKERSLSHGRGRADSNQSNGNPRVLLSPVVSEPHQRQRGWDWRSPPQVDAPVFPSSDRGRVMFDEEATKAFVVRIRESLMCLLLSDLGSDLWAQGSETDVWFSDDLVETCRRRKEEQQRSFMEAVQERSKAAADKALLAAPLNMANKQAKVNKHYSKKSFSGFVGFFGLPSSAAKSAAAPVATTVSTALDVPDGPKLPSTSSSEVRLRIDTNVPTADAKTKMETAKPFPYVEAYKKILHRMSVDQSPSKKLQALSELAGLVMAALASSGSIATSTGGMPRTGPTLPMSPMLTGVLSPMLRGMVSPPGSPTLQSKSASYTTGTKPDHLAELHSRRAAHTLMTAVMEAAGSPFLAPSSPYMSSTPVKPHAPAMIATDAIVEEMQRLLDTPELRSKTLFRDLQYISCFVSQEHLDTAPEGKILWDFGLSAVGIRKEAVDSMAAYATSLLQDSSSSLGGLGISLDEGSFCRISERQDKVDAARALLIAAKEGDPTSQREFAILQISQPSIVPTSISPFARPSEVLGRHESYTEEGDREKYDPVRIAIAQHWLSLASAQGDNVAGMYLSQMKNWTTPQDKWEWLKK
ncbi:hypothetical protein YB2330_001017 [Saitoella coloradoensis]